MTPPASFMAIDPGAISGAFAYFDLSGEITVGDIPVVDRQIDAAALARIIQHVRVTFAVVELVASMPKQGVASTFRFGYGCGIIRGVLAAKNVPTHYVTPQVWKKKLGLLGKDKEASRALATRLYPGVEGLSRKKDQGRAEALLLGHWFMTKE